ncbi:unnamed protein product [Taenia asiatica]|uniref:Kelch-like protein 10 n=1 Tax=Taenia asiatica TaxID=60517 RepID=A0A0R3VX60_TAEAS|nr:unnamed protein product [Taenia asiatica]
MGMDGVVAIGHFIYAVGGYDSHSQLRSLERFNTEQNVWEYMTSMLHPRSALSASVLDGKIWVFGELVALVSLLRMQIRLAVRWMVGRCELLTF